LALWLALPLFVASVAVTLAAAALFADRLDHIGPRVGLPEALTGLVTALAADGPEISSALIALAQGEKRVSLGVVLGSNAFNLAAMIGVSAVVAGVVRIGRRALAVEGAVALLATAVGAGVITGVLSAGLAMALLAATLVPYLLLIGRGASHAGPPMVRAAASTDDPALWKPIALAALAVVLIVVGALGMVNAAVSIADRWGISAAIVGTLVLASLTSLPNAFTAIRLGVSHRGAALVSETLNSNTINLAVGVVLPALFLSVGGVSGLVGFDLVWLAVMTSFALLLLARTRGAGRGGGIALIAMYLAFVVVHVIGA
jgi:cation:H+ antiporter